METTELTSPVIIKTLRDCATDEFMEKYNQLTDPLHIKIIDRILAYEYFFNLSY